MAPRRTAYVPPTRPQHSVEQKRAYANRLKKRIEELQAFDPETVQRRFNDPTVIALEAGIEDALSAAFGHGTPEYQRYIRATQLDHGPVEMQFESSWISARGGGHAHYDDTRDARRYIAEGKQEALALLKRAVKTLEEEIEEEQQFSAVTRAAPESQRSAEKQAYNIHLSGDNPRVNIHSNDHSSNAVSNNNYDMTALGRELTTLREALLINAKTPEEYMAIGSISEAEVETKSGDISRVKGALAKLGGAGHWVLKTAKEVGVQVAAEIIKSQIVS